MELKKPLSFEDQVSRLIEHGMTVPSKRDAAEFLKCVNYYRFTGYALQFRAENGQDYRPETNFNTVRRIYQFDAELRGILRIALDAAEAMFRTQIANGFVMAKCQEAPYDGHYLASNFYRPELQQEVLNSLLKEEERRTESLVVKHHKQQYNDKMPLWVIVELLSLSSLSALYYAMYLSEQQAIADSCGKTVDLFRNHLHVLTVLRNKCSHGARLYNTRFVPPPKLGPSYLHRHPEVANETVFAAILVLFRNLPLVSDRQMLFNSLCNCLSKYEDVVDLDLIGFPENYRQLLTIELNRI
jgi:abortive infection bacteriophage resistance protein